MKAPHQVSFVWPAAWGKIFTGDYLRRGVPIVDWCCLCWCSGESVDHLLLHCGEVSWLWSLALRLFGVAWVLPKKIIDLLAGWKNWLGSSVRIFGIWYHIV